MKVLLSWSGERSRKVAEALYEWLPSVVQQLEPFMSPWGIDRDSRWYAQVARKLSTSGAGVVCLTPEDLIYEASSWLQCEVVAIAKAVEQQNLRCTYLLDVESTEVTGRLAQFFQATRSDLEDTLRLVSSLNARVAAPLAPERLENAFATWWPDLEHSLKIVRAMPASHPRVRSQPDKSESVPCRDCGRMLGAGEHGSLAGREWSNCPHCGDNFELFTCRNCGETLGPSDHGFGPGHEWVSCPHCGYEDVWGFLTADLC
ncbi:MAG TPA: hypothetical protein VE974_24945 [Thermoanaerobaculia bacterium]|nr:hypothetical protein [Thermoanaerobaculia bacterium]